MTNLETALSYLEKNYSVVTVWSPSLIKRQPCKFHKKLNEAKEKNSSLETPKSDEEITKKALIDFCKKPCIKTWKEYQKRLPTKEEVTAWFTKYPDANIGIITGEVSNLVVFDLDSDKAKKYAEDRGGFPQTITARSSKEDRYHKYMKYPGFEVKNNVSKKLDIDIRGDGGLIVAPPSIHGSGVQYKWEEGFSPEDTKPAECAPWMIDYLKSIAESEKPTKRKVESDQSKNTTEEKKNEDNKYVKIIREGFIHGERNAGTIGFLGHLFKTKLKPEEIWEMAKIWNMKNKPPIDLDELRTIFNSAQKMEKESQMNINSFLYDPNKASAEYEQKFVHIPFGGTNLTNLEEHMNGGLIGGNLYILGGIPSSGKTATINNIADNICLNGQPVLFFSYDDGRQELFYRTLSRFSEHSIEVFNGKYLSSIRNICDDLNISKIMSLKYVVQGVTPIESWNKLFIEPIMKKHAKAPVIIIDYLRKLRTKKNNKDERLRVDDIISNLTNLAKEYNIPILAISELARDSYKSGQRLSMASFKESGNIEYEASWLGILAVVEECNGSYMLKDNWESIIQSDGNIDLIVFKAKRGTGIRGKVPLKLNPDRMSILDRDTAIINKLSRIK